ncbi:MAG: leucine-rich repeat domain-containing protein [Bacteroidetes bacterium]|nr:leucine-rich repeat domain-containing protein [Bacteroidota bacterium]
MSELALQLIAENKAKHERGEDATYLDLGRCGLTKLPVEIKELVWVETLILSDDWWEYDSKEKKGALQYSQNKGEPNRLVSLKGIEKCAALRHLVISQRYREREKKIEKLQDLTPLQNLINLQILYCSSTQIKNLTPLQNLINLQILYCSSTQINDLTPLQNLINLQILYCNSTQINDLAPLQNLLNLQILYCSSTQINDLAPLQNLLNLQQLFCSSTQINDLAPLQNLLNLQVLNCYSTQINDLTPLQNLINLQILDCSSTQINDLTPLQNLINLQKLECFNTQINNLTPLRQQIKMDIYIRWEGEEIYEELGTTGILVKINSLKNCPLTNPPVEVAKQGNEAILAYWEQLEKQGAATLNEAKLLIVGEGKTGKTTLFKKLIDPAFDPLNEPTDETHGINIHEGLKIGYDFRANLWDFGGQELQYMTHQFFLSPKALYVLMMEARAEAPNLAYWFKIISLLGREREEDKVSLLLVLNKKKGGTGMPQYQDLLKLYESDFDYQFLEVDLADNDKRWECLHEAVTRRLAELPIVKNILPKQWGPIRDALREEGQEHNYITTLRLHEICSEYEVTEEIDQFTMTGYLHQLGALLHFQNDPDLVDVVILRPEWAVEGVYTTLKSDLIKETQRGKFTTEDIFHILRGKGYSSTDAQKILKLMSKNNFDICYETDEKGHYVAAQLLPDNRPEQYAWYKHVGALQFRYEYPIMPKGLMSRLIVRLSAHLEKVEGVEIVWKKGAVLNITREGTLCRLLMYEDDGESKSGLKQIVIEVLEENEPFRNRKYALELVRREVQSIHQKWFKNIKFEEWVPCNCEVCKNSEDPFSYKLSELVKLTKGKAFCNRLEDNVPVVQLLEGVYQSGEIMALQPALAGGRRHEPGFGGMDFNPVFQVNIENKPSIQIANTVKTSDVDALKEMLEQMSADTKAALTAFVDALPEPDSPEEKTGLGRSILKWIDKNAEGIAVNVSASVYYDALKGLLGLG